MKQDRKEPETSKSQISKKRKREKPLVEKLPSADSGYNCKFARALGSVDWHTREQGLHALTVWLTRNDVSDEDLTKIWKALFFCFWHSDKAPVQVPHERLLCSQTCVASSRILTSFIYVEHTSVYRPSLQTGLPPSCPS